MCALASAHAVTRNTGADYCNVQNTVRQAEAGQYIQSLERRRSSYTRGSDQLVYEARKMHLLAIRVSFTSYSSYPS